MDIEFFTSDGGSYGITPEGWDGDYVTADGETSFERLLRLRGLLYLVERRALASEVASRWADAQARMPPAYTPLLRGGPPNVRLPKDTHLFLPAPPLPAGHAWGRAKLEGASVQTAWRTLREHLMAGAAELAHDGPSDLLAHLLNTPLRQGNGVAHIDAAALGQSLTGPLYFRAKWARGAPLPIAVDETGRTVVVEWVHELDDLIYLHYRSALDAFDTDMLHMTENLTFLVNAERVMKALYDVAKFANFRQGQMPHDENALTRAATRCRDALIHPSFPSGSFGFAWNMADSPNADRLASLRRLRLDLYRTLRDVYKECPELYVGVVNDLCEVEMDMLTSLAADPITSKRVQPEIASALAWLGTKREGTPPDDSYGLGLLLSLIWADLPSTVDPPSGLLKLSVTAQILHGISAPTDSASRQPFESRIKTAFAATFAFPKEWHSQFMKPSGWLDLWGAIASGTSSGGKDLKAAGTVIGIPKSALDAKTGFGRFLLGLDGKANEVPHSTMAKLKLARFDCPNLASIVKLVGFVSTGIGLVDDVVNAGGAFADPRTDPTVALAKLAKDSLGAYGTYVRDFAKTRAQIAFATGRIDAAKLQEIKDIATKTENFGILLGVASGVWSTAAAYQDGNSVLTAAGLLSLAAAGMKSLLSKDLLVGLGFDLSWPVSLAASALEVYDAFLAPPKTDKLIRDRSVQMLRGTLGALRDWYERHPPWRPEITSHFDRALEDLAKMADDVQQDPVWHVMLPCSDDDVQVMRSRLVQIGFDEKESQALVPTEREYLFRDKPVYETLPDPIYWTTGDWN